MKWFHSVFAIALLLVCSGAALSQSYPAKPVRIMVGYTPGGGVDTTAGNVATEYTAKAPSDGYTLVLCSIGSHAVTPARFRGKLNYDPIRDFAFPSMIGGVPNVFMVHPSMPAKTLRCQSKSRQGKFRFVRRRRVTASLDRAVENDHGYRYRARAL